VSDNLDLNLLRVFDALLDTGSVSGAATRLHLSVPANSRALGRRRSRSDPPVGSEHCRRARPELAADRSDSEPQTWRRSFAVSINDGLAPVLAPRLSSRIASEAPGVSLRFVPDDSDHPDALRNGSVDLDIGLAEPPGPDVKVQDLYTGRYVALVSAESQLGRSRRHS
jgi:DNA-binding transcriptional LysR family regulator